MDRSAFSSALAAATLVGVGVFLFQEQGTGELPDAGAPTAVQPPDLTASAKASGELPGSLPSVLASQRSTVTNARIENDEASVPSQCYTKTEGRHNPCYTCHQTYDASGGDRLNGVQDGALQGEYSFSDVGVTNHYQNLWVDRKAWIESISDETILAYVNSENYSTLSQRLVAERFDGFVPDLKDYQLGALAFDQAGLAKDGSNWVAFNYKPFPGTFWPTNGATDDVLVRLPRAFREVGGAFNRDAYYVNLTLVELTIKDEESLDIWPVDESALGVDLDGNQRLGLARKVKRLAHYVGDAKETPVEFQQLPLGAEFLHSVRYLGLTLSGGIVIPPRMKELRYMRKMSVMTRSKLRSRYAGERKEKRLEKLPKFLRRGDSALDNGLGWFVQGFVEDYDGELRPQSYEEGVACMGCHSAIGTTIDSTFSLARKVSGARGWGYIDLEGMPDAPSVSEAGGEILNYLKRAGGGSEFRENDEMRATWFKPNGEVDEAKVMAADVAQLISPSKQRALRLNKAYTQIVRTQSYTLGRDATLLPARNVHKEADESEAPLAAEYRYLGWDIRLKWDSALDI